MARKPTYEELAKRVKELEQESDRLKLTEEALGVAEQKYNLFASMIPGTAWKTDKDLRFTISRGSGLASMGLEQDQVVGMSLYEFFNTDDYMHPAIRAHLDALEGNESVYDYAHLDRTYRTRVSQVRTTDGKIDGVSGLAIDITEQRKAEETLRGSEEQRRTLFDNLPSGIVIHAADTSVLSANPEALRVLGLTMEQMQGKATMDPAWRFLREDGVPLSVEELPVNRVLSSGKPIKNQIVGAFLPDRDVPNWGLCNAYPQLDASGQVIKVVVTFIDITERKRAEEEREKLQVQLTQAQKMESIGTLAGGIAHDFNNILSPLMLHTEMALMDAPADSLLKDSLQQIYKAAERARDLVKQILTFARKSEKERVQIKASLMVKEAIKFLRSSIPTTIDLHYDIRTKQDTVLADPTQFSQIIMNLCTNAAQAMDERGGVIEVILENEDVDPDTTKEMRDLEPGRYVKLTVKDTGQGIEPENMAKIFDPYFTTKEVGKGTGLGLPLVHGIVLSHGGAITVESEVGQGTAFHIYLPLSEGDRVVVKTRQDTGYLPSGTERILFVDDEQAIGTAFQSQLERLGYRVTVRTSSIEALEAFRYQPEAFDLVISDMTMPNMTGKELAKELLLIRPDIPVILCTGFSEHIDEHKAKAMGIRALVMKPVVMSQMASAIREVLDEKDLAQQ